jgi:hypothetical protein
MQALRDIVSRFVTDANGAYLEDRAAKKLVGALTRPQLKEALAAFGEQLRDALVPPESAAS